MLFVKGLQDLPGGLDPVYKLESLSLRSLVKDQKASLLKTKNLFSEKTLVSSLKNDFLKTPAKVEIWDNSDFRMYKTAFGHRFAQWVHDTFHQL